MEKNVKMVVFDMDGTIADLYGVENWLTDLRRYNAMPYRKAEPMWDMVELAQVLNQVQAIGIEVRIVTWLSKDTNADYDRAVRQAKQDWLQFYEFPFDHFHGVQYGATKADSVRRYLAEDESAILFDDNAKVRQGWHMGEAIDPNEVDIIGFLRDLIAENL